MQPHWTLFLAYINTVISVHLLSTAIYHCEYIVRDVVFAYLHYSAICVWFRIRPSGDEYNKNFAGGHTKALHVIPLEQKLS